MKEYKEIQRLQNLRPNPAFTVRAVVYLAHQNLNTKKSNVQLIN